MGFELGTFWLLECHSNQMSYDQNNDKIIRDYLYISINSYRDMDLDFTYFHEFPRIFVKDPNSRITQQKLDEFNSPDKAETRVSLDICRHRCCAQFFNLWN